MTMRASAIGFGTIPNYDFLDQGTLYEGLYLHKSPESATVLWHLPAVHCPSCVRLLEDWPRRQGGIDLVRVDFSQKKAQIRFDPRVLRLSELASGLSALGFPPDLSMAANDSADLIASGPPLDRRAWMELGLAGFVFGNTMLFALPEYMGLSTRSGISDLLRALTAALSLPLIFYSARSFFQSAWGALRQKQATMDVPIVLGILALAGQSWMDVLGGTGPGYFDSLAGLIFFLLLGRWFQHASYAKLNFERDYKHFFPFSVLRLEEDGQERHVPIAEIKTGQRMRIRQGETVPVDSQVLLGQADLDLAFITGESLTQHASEGSEIPAGARLVLGTLEVKALRNLNQSYLTSLWSGQNKSLQSPALVRWMDALGRRFTVYVLLVSSLSYLYWVAVDSSQALWVVTSVLIVACPCALSLAIPFGLGNVLRQMASQGALLKSTDTVVQLTKVTDWVFDKTGTLTESQTLRWSEESPPDPATQTILAEMCSRSAHPLSRSLAVYWKDQKAESQEVSCSRPQELDDWVEEAGKGIRARLAGVEYRVGSRVWVKAAGGKPTEDLVGVGVEGGVFWSVQGGATGKVVPHGLYRTGLKEALEELHNRGQRLHLISGDQDRERQELENLFPQGSFLRFGQSPGDKWHYIQELQKKGAVVAMVGDGLNDAGALAQADLGITVAEDALQFTPACDALIPGEALHKLPSHATMAQKGVTAVRRTLLLSFVYNLIGVGIAVQGLLTPIVSAILMPLSSVSVVLAVLWGTTYAAHKSYR